VNVSTFFLDSDARLFTFVNLNHQMTFFIDLGIISSIIFYYSHVATANLAEHGLDLYNFLFVVMLQRILWSIG
jgi:hypothetical protein